MASFRVTGILQEPQKPETILASTVVWNMSRPTTATTLNESVENIFTDGIASIDLRVHPYLYTENFADFFIDSPGDVVDSWIEATINLSQGFANTATIRFSRTDAETELIFEETASFMILQNVEVRSVRSLSSHYREAFFETRSVGQPKNVFLSDTVYWCFLDSNTVDHWLTVNLDATYFNGTAYRKATLPITLGVLLK
jgi:hypothetical protein